MEKLSVENSYRAMYLFLFRLYEMTDSDDLAGFLGSMSLLEDGKPVDPAVWNDWLNAINDSLKYKDFNEFMKFSIGNKL